MKNSIKTLAATFIVSILSLWLISISFDIATGEYSFRQTFKEIKPGDSHANILSLLGEPDEKTKKFRLGQYKGFEKEYEKAKKINSEYYLIWERDIDVVYAVGFNNEHKVTLTASGGT